MPYNSEFLAHMRAVSQCLPLFEARAHFDVTSFALEVQARGRYFNFVPQFIDPTGPQIQYTTKVTPQSTGFLGWLPYFNKRWDLAIDKLAFKRFCREHGIQTPRSFEDQGHVDVPVIIKRGHGSFSEGLRGPFSPEEARKPENCLVLGEFYEEFTFGEIAKIWYWNDTLVCIEIKPMAKVTGDGHRSLRELIMVDARATVLFRNAWDIQEALARYQGTSLDAVPEEGQSVLSDFRYHSPLNRLSLFNINALKELQGTEVGKTLTALGPTFRRGIPDSIRDNTLIAVDAIIDPQKRLWFLEMNCNPVVPPDAYPAIFESLFGKAVETRTVQRPTRLPIEPSFPNIGVGIPASFTAPAGGSERPAATLPLRERKSGT